MTAVLLEDGPDPAPSSRSNHGSTSRSWSGCVPAVDFDFPSMAAAVAVRTEGEEFLGTGLT